jgi:hypothetical protein
MHPSRTILTAFIAFYAAMAGFKQTVLLDYATGVGICLFAWILVPKLKIKPFIAFLIGIAFVPHLIGLEWMYANPFMDYNFDKIVHIVTSFLATIILFFLFRHFTKLIFALLLAFTLCITLGVVIEQAEYVGFLWFGVGEGYLGFGDGDNSQNFGPWEDSIQDQLFNFGGGIAAVASLLVLERIRKDKKEKNYSKPKT